MCTKNCEHLLVARNEINIFLCFSIVRTILSEEIKFRKQKMLRRRLQQFARDFLCTQGIICQLLTWVSVVLPRVMRGRCCRDGRGQDWKGLRNKGRCSRNNHDAEDRKKRKNIENRQILLRSGVAYGKKFTAIRLPTNIFYWPIMLVHLCFFTTMSFWVIFSLGVTSKYFAFANQNLAFTGQLTKSWFP